MKTLAAASPTPATFDANTTMQLVSDWLTKYGKDLKGICAADDSAQALGIFQALEKAGRTDVVVVAAGNSKQGMDLVKEGKLFGITYQTAEGDGALGVNMQPTGSTARRCRYGRTSPSTSSPRPTWTSSTRPSGDTTLRL